jgi:hypothetical protein
MAGVDRAGERERGREKGYYLFEFVEVEVPGQSDLPFFYGGGVGWVIDDAVTPIDRVVGFKSGPV